VAWDAWAKILEPALKIWSLHPTKSTYGLSLGFRVQGSGFRVQGSGFRVQGSGFRVQGSGFRV
jgi:hypothetical protein